MTERTREVGRASSRRLVLRATAIGLAVATASSALAAGRALLPPRRPAGLGLDVETTGSVVPATRPASPGGLVPVQGGPAPLQNAAAPAGRAAPGEREIVAKASAMLNGISTLVADFNQVGGDGRRFTGTLSLQRPGKVRFEYDKPSTLEIVSDGSTVLVRDRKLNTSDPYPIGQTPLKFLLASRIDLARETNVQSAEIAADGARVSLVDSSTLGGTSKITLYFDRDITMLTRWRVVDPQGYTTTVSLADQDRNKPIDPKTFQLNYSRPVE